MEKRKDNQMMQMTLKEFIDQFEQDSNYPTSTLMAVEETIRVVREEHKTEIDITIGII